VVEEPNLPALDLAPPEPKHENLVANRYEILSQIGTGGMGAVFRVRHVELGKTFALKIIHSEMSENARVREMFYSEARLASSLEHKNIVSITDFGEDFRRGAFIVMEYLKGEALADRLERDTKVSAMEACDILLQAADAVAFMHRCGVIHGDIKPENIFLAEGARDHDRRRNSVKVLDFGLSRLSLPYGAMTDDQLAGTPAYLAPERICGAPPDEKSDLYALGVLFYEALTGRVPFDGSVAQILNAHLSVPPTPPSLLVNDPAVDERLDEVVLTCLAKEPSARYSDARVFAEALREHMSYLGISRRRRSTSIPAPVPRTRYETYRRIVDANPLPIFAVNAEGELSLANRSFALFINEDPNRLTGRKLLETRLGLFAPGLAEDLDHVLSHNKVTSRELELTQPGGNKSVVLVWMAPLVLGGIITGAHGVVHWVKR
jgi:serine/threonine protein kinase